MGFLFTTKELVSGEVVMVPLDVPCVLSYFSIYSCLNG